MTSASLGLALPVRFPARNRHGVTRRLFASSGGIAVNSNLRLMYLLALTGKADPVICFLPTAQADSTFAIAQWYELMNELPCRPRHLGVFGDSAGVTG